MKILIIRFSSIGDIVLTTPVIRCLKKQLPGVQIHFLTKAVFKPILAHNPYIEHIHTLGKSIGAILPELKAEKFDLVIDLHKNLRTLRIKLGLSRPTVAFDKLNVQKFLFTAFKINHLPGVHIVDRYMATVERLGVKQDGEGLDYFLSTEDDVALSTLPQGHQQGFIALVIGAAHGTKRLPVNKLIDLCKGLHKPIVLFGGEQDKPVGQAILAALEKEGPSKVVNTCGQYTLSQSASLLSKAQMVITNDTGLMHIAAAFKLPIVSLWGNTVPDFGMYPYYGKHTPGTNAILEVQNLPCRPCSKIGYETCPKGHFKCMNLIPMEQVVDLCK